MEVQISPSGFWKQLLLGGCMSDIQEQLSDATNQDVPKNLVHLACQQELGRRVNPNVVQFLAERLTHQLGEVDESGRIPLHYVCQWRSSLASLPVLHALLAADPDTILYRWQEDEDDDEDDEGVLPSVLAHHCGAPPTVVQYLLRRQLEAHNGLVLTHNDLSYLRWGEEHFLELVAEVLQQLTQEQPDVIHQVRLEECRLSYDSWKLLQNVIRGLPAGQLRRLQLIRLHVWSENFVSTRRQLELTHNDTTFWQRTIAEHQQSLRVLEMPRFYALSTQTVRQMAAHLAQPQDHYPHLQVLDVRAPETAATNSNHKRKRQEEYGEEWARVVRSPGCRLQSLSLSNPTGNDLVQIIQGMEHNRSLSFCCIEDIVVTDDEPLPSWNALRLALETTLRQNTSLERFLGPRSLVGCPRIQHYLRLNRDYHRRDIGRWSPALVAHILAKQGMHHKSNQKEERHWKNSVLSYEYLEPQQYARSAMFSILQTRPDIVAYKQ